MKKYLTTIIISLLLGGLLSYYVLNLNNEDNKIYTLEVLNTFDYNEASKINKKYKSSMLLQDNNGYHVILAIYNNIDIINKMLVYYEDNNIDVYLNKIECNKEFLSKLNKYEDIINNIDNLELYNDINKNILNMYKESI